MKYNYKFKLNAVKMYQSGQWIETPVGIGQKNFRKRIVQWSKTAEIHGFDFFNIQNHLRIVQLKKDMS
ncbi:hypothetical protein [Streptococcus catagoni]|uniref:hypothetical protein n=1 Tax=Streptococcus catagoni TaxID=2654874 RepID=UPI001F3596C7|nr:hypothetical protein [Streptococcus catagoni]